jgi:hypothetical protein
MYSTTVKTQVLLLGLILIQACSLPGLSQSTPTPQPPAAEPIPVTGPQQPDIEHQDVPVALPAERSGHAGDYVSSDSKSAVGGDRFTLGLFERPFNANTMDVYFPSLDIIDTFVYQDDLWIYGTIEVMGRETDRSLVRRYALELDLDVDGKGDWLVVALNPASSDWSVEGVQVLQDSNSDVGNQTAMFTDSGGSGDGFETLVFDQGSGTDPDGAWARVSPENQNIIQIAVKRALLGDTQGYLIGMWAGSASLDAVLFDVNDHYTHEQAGAADRGYEVYYPIKAVAELDNSCRMAVGFVPTGQEPGLCKLLSPESEGGCPPCPEGWYQIPPSCTCYLP